MQKTLLAITVALVAQFSFAAVQYEFRETSHSDVESVPATQLNGRAIIDGSRSRIDFLSGNAYPAGTYMVSTDGSRSMLFVDPANKVYTEINALGIASAIGSAKITVENLQSSVTKLDDKPVIASFPTEHYRLTLTYDMTVTFGNVPIKQTIKTTVDKWTTAAFGELTDPYSGGGIRTGHPQLDQMIDLEETKISGFALRQTVSIVTSTDRSPRAGSQLKIKPTRTHRREMTITSIKQATPRPLDFIVPAAYTKSSPENRKDNSGSLTVLSMEPSSK